MSQEPEDGIVRFDTSLVKKLQGEISSAREEREEIIRGSRLYWQRVQAVHEAVLLLMEADHGEEALALLQEDVARLLGFDAICFFYERLASDASASLAALFRAFPAQINLPSAAGQDVILVEDLETLRALFPEASGLLAFALCLPLHTGERRGMLVLGQRDAQYLSVGQALEPYMFLARALERMGKTWLTRR